MNDYLRWLLGIKSSPDWITGTESRWHVEFQSLPTGGWAAAAVLAGVAGALGIWWLYRREGRSLGLATRLVFFTLRALVLVGVAFMLLEMVLVITKHERIPSHLLVLVDTSESMALKDPYPDEAQARKLAERIGLTASSGEPDAAQLRQRARFDLAARALDKTLVDLGDRRTVWRYRFDSTLTPLAAEESIDMLKPVGATTGIGTALAGALAAHRGQPLAGILLATDGRSTSGEDPLAIASEAGKAGVPIVSLAVGTDEGPRNVRLAAVEANKVALVNDPIEIGVLVESRGFKDASATVVLEERQDDGAWKEIGREQVAIGEEGVIKKVAFRKTPDTLGQLDLRARVTDVGQELDESDNTATASIRVVRERIRVLAIAGYPSPEMQFLRNALLRDTGLELATWLQSADGGYQQIGHRPLRRLPANQEELDHYDVLILLDPDLRKLAPGWPDMLVKFVGNAGGGLVFVAGEVNSQRVFNPDPGDASGTTSDGRDSWARILPVVRDPGLYQSTADVRLSSRETYALELTNEGTSDPIFAFDANPNRNREVLASLPGMYWHFPVTRAKVGAKVLAHHGDPRMRNTYGRHVLMAAQRYGPGHTVFLGFDSTYRWRYLHEAYFDGFWARLIDRVGRDKLTGGGYPFRLVTDKGEYRVGDRVTIRAELFDTADNATTMSELRGEVAWGGESSLAVTLEPTAADPRVLEGAFTASEAGAYTARFIPSATGDPDAGLRPATLSFHVAPPHRERDNPTWDRPTLEKLASATGGRVFTLADADQLPEAFRIREVERILEYRDELWDAPLLCGSVLLLLTIEWLLRKRFRMA